MLDLRTEQVERIKTYHDRVKMAGARIHIFNGVRQSDRKQVYSIQGCSRRMSSQKRTALAFVNLLIRPKLHAEL